ncbi:MAG: amino acid ABC transporter ATP-binding protein [Clostridia bacterium]|nr:amino acid ABC transporter ATP-binding protein [Clostridia bacterium]
MNDTILHVQDIYKSFDGNGVLRGVSMEIREGEVVVIVGPSGCGKSTLLRCINGLEVIDSGSIYLRDEKISGRTKDLHLVRQKIGMVFQSYDLFPHMKVMDNLLLGPTKALNKSKTEVEKEALEMLERVGLKEKAYALPRTLSGGQKQRVALVRAMLMRPEILLLDEITAALDPEMVSEVLNVVIDLARGGMTMAIVTHEMRFAEAVADRVVFLEDGMIMEEGKPEEFFSAPKTQRAQHFLQSFTYASKRDKKSDKNNFED